MGNERVYNFSAGPSMLPLEVLTRAGSEITNYQGSGMSVMEMSHRSKVYDKIFQDTKANFIRLFHVPDNYRVLFLQGGASSQFSMVPLNLIGKTGKADYAVTGNFSNIAYKEAKKYGQINLAASSEDKNHTYIPTQDQLKLDPEASYFHYCANNTIYGTEYQYDPETPAGVPLVADMSSNILSKPVDVSKYGVIYAGAQKNMGPAGVTVVIVREDLLGSYPLEKYPVMLDWQTMANKGSMYNTPPAYGIYICGKVFQWLLSIGGLEAIRERNVAKAKVLYDFLDASQLFHGTVVKKDRSLMNVPFVTGNAELDAKFVKAAEAAGFVSLKGHRTVGGMRASIYNAMPMEGVVKLVQFMDCLLYTSPSPRDS